MLRHGDRPHCGNERLCIVILQNLPIGLEFSCIDRINFHRPSLYRRGEEVYQRRIELFEILVHADVPTILWEAKHSELYMYFLYFSGGGTAHLGDRSGV